MRLCHPCLFAWTGDSHSFLLQFPKAFVTVALLMLELKQVSFEGNTSSG
jgi:hypothetical protein